jgi:Nitrogenase molybdenum-iron protein, alpha and beta chains
MARILDKVRNKCALGSMSTVQSIPGVLPILHSGPGCTDKIGGGVGGAGHFSPSVFPCTCISEKEVIFGGDEKLRETIANALKVIDADLYVVLTGCVPEIVGDDVAETVRFFKDAEKPVIYASTGGFKGNSYRGHEWVMEAIIEQYLKPSAKRTKDLVNIWAGLPQHDPFWLGNLRALEELVADLGLTPNTIFGHGRGIKNLDKIPEAQFNLVVSPWLGLSNAELLKEKFGTPYLHYPTLPIGAFETSRFLRELGKFAGVDEQKVAALIQKKEEEYYYYIERFADVFLEIREMSKKFLVVSDSQYTLAVTKFLVNDIGLFPAKQYITDDAPEDYRADIQSYFEELNYGIKAEVEFSIDGYQIEQEIRATDFHGYPLILGSYWEKKIAEEKGASYVSISWPMNEKLVINSSYVGYRGGLHLLEDIYSSVLPRAL